MGYPKLDMYSSGTIVRNIATGSKHYGRVGISEGSSLRMRGGTLNGDAIFYIEVLVSYEGSEYRNELEYHTDLEVIG